MDEAFGSRPVADVCDSSLCLAIVIKTEFAPPRGSASGPFAWEGANASQYAQTTARFHSSFFARRRSAAREMQPGWQLVEWNASGASYRPHPNPRPKGEGAGYAR